MIARTQLFLLSFLTALLCLCQFEEKIHLKGVLGVCLMLILLSVIAVSFTKKSIVSFAGAGIVLAVLRIAYITPMNTVIPDSPLTGIVTDYPEQSPASLKVIVRAGEKKWIVRSLPGTRVSYGDTVRIDGKARLLKPEEQGYFRSQGIAGIIDRANIAVIEKGSGNRVFAAIFGMRSSIEKRINELYPEPQSSLLAGLLIGARASLPKETTEALKQSGLTHIIAISGYNITLLCTLLSGALFFLPLRWRFAPSVAAISVFTLLTGASASAVRAAIMGILTLTAMQTHRIGTLRLTVLWTAFFMTMWNPLQMWYDGSFQLSFLALLGVTEVSPHLQFLLEKIPGPQWLKENAVLTTSAQITTAPWIAYSFGRTSILSLFSNLLAPPAVPFATIIGGISLILSTISKPLAFLMALVTQWILSWMLLVAHSIAAIPFSSVEFPLPGLLTVGWYIALIVWVTKRNASGAPSSARS